jgi:AraC-like DNA-binding protein
VQQTIAASGEWEPPQAEWTVLRVAAGQGYVEFPDDPRILNERDVVLLPAGGRSRFRASRLGRMQLEYFSLRLDLISGLLTVTERHRLEGLARELGGGGRVVPAAQPLASEFGAIGALPGLTSSLRFRFELLRLFVALMAEELAPERLRPYEVAGVEARFRALLTSLSEPELLRSPLSDLARRCNCSARHFSRLFSRHFRMSLRAKQTELRLETARHLLVETDQKVIAIAMDCGYRHLGLFNAMFRKRFGTTPSDIREKARSARLPRRPAARVTPPSPAPRQPIAAHPQPPTPSSRPSAAARAGLLRPPAIGVAEGPDAPPLRSAAPAVGPRPVVQP